MWDPTKQACVPVLPWPIQQDVQTSGLFYGQSATMRSIDFGQAVKLVLTIGLGYIGYRVLQDKFAPVHRARARYGRRR